MHLKLTLAPATLDKHRQTLLKQAALDSIHKRRKRNTEMAEAEILIETDGLGPDHPPFTLTGLVDAVGASPYDNAGHPFNDLGARHLVGRDP